MVVETLLESEAQAPRIPEADQEQEEEEWTLV